MFLKKNLLPKTFQFEITSEVDLIPCLGAELHCSGLYHFGITAHCSLHWITLDVPKLLSSALFVVFISLISVHSRCNNGQSATTLPRYTAEHFSVCITGHWSLHQMHCILNCNVNSAPLQCVSFWNQCMQWPRAYPANRLHADITICQ